MRIIALALALGLTGCSTGSLYNCPYRWQDVKVVVPTTVVLEVPAVELSGPGGPCPAFNAPNIRLNGCAMAAHSLVWMDKDLLPINKRDTFRHEMCHVYEVTVLKVPSQNSAGHLGWKRGAL